MVALLGLFMVACSPYDDAPDVSQTVGEQPTYRIGATDTLQIFVWRNPELSTTIPVRPDGLISVPLIEDLQAAGKTSTQLARDIEKVLGEYVQNPIVTVIVTGFVGPFNQQVRVVGEAAEPQAISFRERMTVLDVMIEVGGLTEFASGNRAVLVRQKAEGKENFRIRLDDLLKEGDMSANVEMLPGDVIIVPQAWF
ncbi:Putative polysaccharide export protein [Magnetospira sp. QH-2]|nr:Putative polysaccharide export protein [Magnetospira sp. QH-2]